MAGQGDPPPSLLHLLYDEAPLADFDALLARVEREGPPEAVEAARAEYDVALRLRDLMGRMRSREAELSALYETASDLTAIRDVDAILAAIVRRARQLLHCDMTYLSLNDEADGASYMKVTDGALTREFETLRVAIYMTIASVITIVAVLLAKETRATSLRHDRVMTD